MRPRRPAIGVLALALLAATATAFLAPSGSSIGPRDAIAKQPDKTPPAKGKPKPTPAPTPRPTPRPTPKPTPRVTPPPTPRPTPKPAGTSRPTATPAVTSRPRATSATARPRPTAAATPARVSALQSETAGGSLDDGSPVVASTDEGGTKAPGLLAGLFGGTLLVIGALAVLLVRRRASMMNARVVLTPPSPARVQLANPMDVMSGDPLLLALDERRGIAPIRTFEHDSFSRPRWVERLQGESGEAMPPTLELLPAEPTTLEDPAEDEPVRTLGG